MTVSANNLAQYDFRVKLPEGGSAAYVTLLAIGDVIKLDGGTMLAVTAVGAPPLQLVCRHRFFHSANVSAPSNPFEFDPSHRAFGVPLRYPFPVIPVGLLITTIALLLSFCGARTIKRAVFTSIADRVEGHVTHNANNTARNVPSVISHLCSPPSSATRCGRLRLRSPLLHLLCATSQVASRTTTS